MREDERNRRTRPTDEPATRPRPPARGARVAGSLTSASRQDAEARFLDAAERLLIKVGYARISTRRLAEEAGLNHGLVHYYFGSMEEVFIRVLERFTGRLIARQQAMYTSSAP